MTEIDSPAVKMIYDGNGMRASKTANGEATLYHYDLANNVISETDDNGKVKATYVYANGMRVCRIDPDGRMFYFHNDPLGSPIMITDEDGNAVQRYVYDPFGTMILSKGPDNNHYTYTGKEYDNESGLMYYGARFYDPKIGRFISRDIAAPDWGDPQSLNRYVYCLNNPLVHIDPDGLDTLYYVQPDALTIGGVAVGHVGRFIEDPDGNWWRVDLSASDKNAALFGPGKYSVVRMQKFNVNEMIEKLGKENVIYVVTTKEQDKQMFKYTMHQKYLFENYYKMYSLTYNNCTMDFKDSAKAMGISFASLYSPIPNDYFRSVQREIEMNDINWNYSQDLSVFQYPNAGYFSWPTLLDNSF